MHVNTLVDILAIKGDRFIAANHIKNIAKFTIGQVSRANTFLINNIISDIIHYTKQMDELKKEIENIVTEHFSNILTIPGVGTITAGLIIGEIGDINRFHSPGALLAYAGLDPIVYESGKFKAKRVSISKRGSNYLRTAIYTSPKVACINPNIKDNKFSQKYLKKRSQGKHHNSAICHTSKNMINLIFSLLRSGAEYNYEY